METDRDESDRDVDEERSECSEGQVAEESESSSSEVEGDDDASREIDEEKETSDVDDEEDGKDEDNKSDSKASVSSQKQDMSDDDLIENIESDETSQVEATCRVDMPATGGSYEHQDSSSDSKGLSASHEEIDSKQDGVPSERTQDKQPNEGESEEEAVNQVSLLTEKPSNGVDANVIAVGESMHVQHSSDSLPHLEVLSVSETKSEFARHPDSTRRQQLSHRVDDQEAELDFEEEVSEERKEETECGEEGEKSQDEDEKDRSKEDGENIDDADDDGELEDDDDLEEGEVKDTVTSTRKPQQRPVCRFFNKGQCTWGTSCRFIHPGINDKGNYNMFGPTKPLVPNNGPIIGGLLGMPLGPLRGHPGYGGRIAAEVVVPPPPVDDVPPVESAWERGLRHAKENLKKANKRKEMEPDFEEKRFNLTLGAGEPEFEKENEFYSLSPFRKNNDPYQVYGYEDPPDPIDRQAQEFWRGGNYENFEVRYLRTEYDNYRVKDKENKERSRREKSNRYDHVHNQDRGGRGGGGWRDNRYAEVQGTARNTRADEWKDPWRRSTSPKRRGRSKSYSSASSGTSYSSGSSRSRSSSFSSHSRSSSGTSYSSRSSHSYSRSRSRNRPSPHRHRNAAAPSSSNAPRKKPPPPLQKSQAPPTKTSRPPSDKRLAAQHGAPTVPTSSAPEHRKKRPPAPPAEKVPAEKRPQPSSRTKRPRSPSISGSDSGSSRSRSSRSSLSRSSSRSSVSSRSSSRSSSVSSISDLERRANGVRRKEKFTDREQQHKLMAHLDPQTKAGSTTRGSKDPLKQSGQKPQIKLTLLNKAKPMPEKSGISPLAHKEAVTSAKVRQQASEKEAKVIPKLPSPAVILGLSKPAKPAPSVTSKPEVKAVPPVKSPCEVLGMEPPKVSKPAIPSSGSSRKRPAPSPSPPRGLVVPPAGNKPSPSAPPQQAPPPPPPPATSAKKSTLSRREELLKQLKAVEDAIARKRAKLT